MRFSIDIDDQLLREARLASGESAADVVIEEGLRLLIQSRERIAAMNGLRSLRGKVEFWPNYDPEDGDEAPPDW
ncbi:MAG: type II toxin-antitoxin system VapB family antitoxin [Tepidiformaceae bacterium]